MADFGNIEVDGFVEQRKELEKLMMSNPAMEKKVQGLIRKVLLAVRSNMSKDAKDVLKTDPRQAYRAVKTTVYRQILGGNVSILRKKKAGAKKDVWEPSSHTGRGGNRRTRSQRTIDLQSYWGADRGFILRFINQGTQTRTIRFTPDNRREIVHRGSRGGNLQKYGKTINTGSRGNIAARNWFGPRSQQEMEKAAENLTRFIDDLITEEFNKQ